MICVYYLDVLSQWCMFADRTVVRLRDKYGERIEFDYRAAPVKDGAPLGYTATDLEWMYRRSESISGIPAKAHWVESRQTATLDINAAYLAAVKMGADPLTVREAIQRAQHRDGRHVARKDEALAIVSVAGAITPEQLQHIADNPAIAAELHANVAELRALGADLRPTFVMQNDIGDRMVLSGTWQFEVLDTCIGSLLADEQAYADFATANPTPF